MSIRSLEGQSLTTIAPVDDRHAVDLPEIRPDQAVRLAQTYLAYFRVEGTGPSSPISPFDESCIMKISQENDGNIRRILQTLHYAIETAVEQEATIIDRAFFDAHYRNITGRVSEQDLDL